MNWPLPSFWELDLLQNPDLIIIGAGFTGLQTALEVKEKFPEWQILVLETRSWGGGASTRNAGFACFGSPSELLSDIDIMGQTAALELLQERFLGLQQLQKRLQHHPVQWEAKDGFELFSPAEHQLLEKCLDALPALNKELNNITGNAITYRKETVAPHIPNGFEAIRIVGEAALHPGQAWFALLQMVQQAGICVLHGTQVQQLNSIRGVHQVQLENGVLLETPRLVLSNNAWAATLLPELAVTPARGLILLSAELPKMPLEGTYHMEEGYVYFRNLGQRLLIGGFRHLDKTTENTFEQAIHPLLEDALKTRAAALLPDQHLHFEYRWTGTMGMGPSKSVILEEPRPGLYTGIRMSGMGVALSARVAERLAERIK